MAGSTRGLGKGLEALFNASPPQGQEPTVDGVQNVALEHIDPNPDQPRKTLSEEALRELAESIRQQGLLQPLLLRPHPSGNGRYQIVAGERRWRASQQAGLRMVPVLIRDISDSDALVIGLVENLQREDLNPVEEARAMGRLLQEMDVSQDELARRLGRSRSAVANTLRLLQLEPQVLEALAQGQLSAGQARTLLPITDPRARLELFQAAVDKSLTVRQMEQAVNFWKVNGRLPASVRPGPKDPSPPDGFATAKAELQKALATRLEAGVRINGHQQKGRITLAYSSETELRRLLHKLGVDPDTCFT